MKKCFALILLLVCGLFSTGCSRKNMEKAASTIAEEQNASYEQEEPTEHTISLRIVDGADTGNLVLAGTEVYTLNVASIPVYLDGKGGEEFSI